MLIPDIPFRSLFRVPRTRAVTVWKPDKKAGYALTGQSAFGTKNRSFEFANRFFKMLGEEKVLRRSVDYYADQLHITPRYLFKICQENTGLTPKQLIDYQIIGDIKKMLLSTDWSIQQVADAMGFPDQASLGQFFKRNEGVSPLAFRKSFR